MQKPVKAGMKRKRAKADEYGNEAKPDKGRLRQEQGADACGPESSLPGGCDGAEGRSCAGCKAQEESRVSGKPGPRI